MEDNICPVWVGYFLSSPLRKLSQNPKKILAPYIKEKMWVLDAGCAMGFFSIPIARMVGKDGRVISVDIQPKMIERLEKKAKRAGLSEIIDARVCTSSSLGLRDFEGKIDFALAFSVVHEVSDQMSFFSEIYELLKPGAMFLVAEPKSHVSKEAFRATVSNAEKRGFKIVDSPEISRSRSTLLIK